MNSLSVTMAPGLPLLRVLGLSDELTDRTEDWRAKGRSLGSGALDAP